jgi:hypothetical protein
VLINLVVIWSFEVLINLTVVIPRQLQYGLTHDIWPPFVCRSLLQYVEWNGTSRCGEVRNFCLLPSLRAKQGWRYIRADCTCFYAHFPYFATFAKVRKATVSHVCLLYHMYDETDLVTTVRITRLRWAGHIVRMQDNLPCKKITLDKPEGRRRVGRQNLWWMDGVMRDAEGLGVRNWKSKAKDRDGWRRLLESAKTLHGL